MEPRKKILSEQNQGFINSDGNRVGDSQGLRPEKILILSFYGLAAEML